MKRLSLFWSKRNRFVLLIGLILILGLLILAGIKLKIFASTVSTSSTGANCKYLISYGISNRAFPEYIANNLSSIEQNYPYDGQGIQTSIGASTLMTGTALTYDAIKNSTVADNQIYKLFNITPKPTKLKHNLFQVLLRDPGDMMTNDAGWNTAANNFANFAQVLKDLDNSGFGVDGILFDNEGPYGAPSCNNGTSTPHGYWNLPLTSDEISEYNAHPDCWPYIRNWGTYSAAQYHDKARQRGKQIMQALVSKFPDIKLVFMHSTDVSCDGMDHLGIQQNDVAYANDMLGSFAVGLAEGAYGTSAKVIDGGEESYGYTTDALFLKSYNMRKTQLPTVLDPSTGKIACPFIPEADKSIWPNLMDVGFGLYNKVLGLGGGQTVSTIGNSTKLALTHSDNYVWFYVEGVTTIGNTYSYPQIDKAWTDAIKAARIAVPNDPTCDSTGTPIPTPTMIATPIVTPTPTPTPTAPILCEPTAPSNLLTTAASSTQVIVSWKDNSSNENGFSLERKLSTDSNFVEVYNTQAANLITYQDSNGISAGNTYNYRVRAYNGCGTGVSAYSNIATVTTPNPLTEPAAPTSLTATSLSSSKINLVWRDNSTNENGFAIERRRSSSSSFVQVATVNANITTYQDTGLSSNTLYYYRVRAFNNNGTGLSAYSNISSAKTKKRWIIF